MSRPFWINVRHWLARHRVGRCPGPHRIRWRLLVRTPTMHAQVPGPYWMCETCSDEYLEQMQDQWNAYYGGCQ